MAFPNRWKIEWPMTTRSPLHIGDGETITHPDIHDKKDKNKLAQIAATATDCKECAYVPGTALKGCLRSWVKKHLEGATDPGSEVFKTIERVFGSADTQKKDFVGGKAEFHNALAEPSGDLTKTPYWCNKRLTGVSASVAIDRRRRTAADEKLFYHEFVPPGVTFACAITAQDLSEEEAEIILAAIGGLIDADDPIAIGAETGDGYGRFDFEWKNVRISRIDSKKDVLDWIKNHDAPVGFSGMTKLTDAERDERITNAKRRYSPMPRASLEIGIELLFDGPFLVNDPSQCKDKRKEESPDTKTDKRPDHAPLRDETGNAYLPSSSIRGAVRAQAERIIRTLNSEAACYSTDSPPACKPVYEKNDVMKKLCLACQVFGASGWRSPIDFPDFHQVPKKKQIPFAQEMVAIDRFTGGVSGSAKFDATAVYQPVLKGTVKVDLARIEPWGAGLLALVMRDLMEGDIPLGFGAAKGYGACTATITELRIKGEETIHKEFGPVLKKWEITPKDLMGITGTKAPDDKLKGFLTELLNAFHKKVDEFRQDKGGTNG